MPYDPTIYRGSAAHYRYGRPAYSPELQAVLTQKAGLDGTGRLLDVGCGPGVLTIRLAHLFERAVGLDPDAGMLAEGRRAAEEKGVTNIRWVQGLAEDLSTVAPGPYKLVTFGKSFHWTDEQRVAEAVYDMLGPGGALALIAHTVTSRPRPPDPGVPPIPHGDLKALVAKYLGSTRRAGQGTAQERTHRFEAVLTRTRFGVPQQLFVPGIPDLLRDSESVLSMNRNNLFRRHFRPLAQKAGLPQEARLYTLRHTFATLWMESNEPVKVLQEILGHSRIDQTMNTYAHVMAHIQADAFGRFSKRFSQR